MPFNFVEKQASPQTGGFVFMDNLDLRDVQEEEGGKVDLPGWKEPEGTVSNLMRGIGETGLTMAGRGFQFVGRGLETAGATDLGAAAKEKGEELVTTGLGFKEATPEAMESAWAEGDYWTAAKEAFKFGGTTAVSSLPWAALAVTPYGIATSGLLLIEDIASERARNSGRTEANWEDFFKSTPSGLASTMLDRVGLKGILRAGRSAGVSEKTLGAFAEYAKAVGKETATEALQEPIEYAGETVGTPVGFQPMEAAKRGLYGALGGAAGGAGFGAVTTPINRMLERRQALGELPEEVPQFTTVGPEPPEVAVPPPVVQPPVAVPPVVQPPVAQPPVVAPPVVAPPVVAPSDPLAEAVAKNKQRLMDLYNTLAERGANPPGVSQIIPTAKQLPTMGLTQDPGLSQWGDTPQLSALIDSINGQRVVPQAGGRNKTDMFHAVTGFLKKADSTFNEMNPQSPFLAALRLGEQDPKIMEGLLQAENPKLLKKVKSMGGTDAFARMLLTPSVLEQKRDLKPGDVATVGAYKWRDALEDEAWFNRKGRESRRNMIGQAKREAQEVESVIAQTRQFVQKYMPGAAVVLDFRASSKTNRFGEHGMLGGGTMVSMLKVNKGDTIATEALSGRYAPAPGADYGPLWNPANRLDFKLRLMNTLSHELGHALVAHEFTIAPDYVQRAIMAEYQLWLEERAKGTVGDLVAESNAVAWQASRGSQQPLVNHREFEYLLSFEEYMARRVADYASGRALFEDAGGLAPFWKRVVNKLRALYNSLVKPLDPESSFVKWMETLSLKGEIDAMEEVQREQHKQRLAMAKEAVAEPSGESLGAVPWTGGKGWLAKTIKQLYQTSGAQRFVDLFAGAGSVSNVVGARGVVNDSNPHIMNLHQAAQQGVVYDLPYGDNPTDYKAARDQFNGLVQMGQATGPDAAKLYYYLSKLTWGGKQELGPNGEFWGTYGKGNQKSARTLQGPIPAVLPRGTRLSNTSFENVALRPGDFVYADPPYWGGQTKMYDKGFGWGQQVALAQKLAAHDGPVVASNSNTPEIRQLYEALGFTVQEIKRPGGFTQGGAGTSELLMTKGVETAAPTSGEDIERPQLPVYREMQAGLSSSSAPDVRMAINKVFDKLQLRGLDEKRISRSMARFNGLMKFALTLPQLERENWGVPGMRPFTDGMRRFWAEKGGWAERWDKWIDQANGLSKGQQAKLWEFANNVTLMSDKLERMLTPVEIAAEAQKVGGLSPEQMALYANGRKILAEAFEENYKVEQNLLAKEWADKDPIMHAARLLQLEEEYKTMMNRDYWPLSRFGRYAVYVKMKTGRQAVYEGKTFKGGQTVLFELYETESAQIARKEALMKALGKDNVDVAADTVDESLFAFMGMPPSMLRRIEKEMMAAAAEYQMGTDPDQDQTIQDLLRDQLRALRLARLEMSPEHAFAQRMQRRKGVKGFSENGLRSMAYWGRSFSNHIARVKWKPEMDDALSVMAKHKYDISRTDDPGLYDQGNIVGDLLNHLRRHQHEVLYPGNDWANLRALGFMWYLGFVPRAALIQPFQILTTTGPWLASRFGDGKATAQLVKTATMMHKLARQSGRLKLRADEQAALKAGYDAGFIDEGLFSELGAVAEGSNLQRILPGKFLKSETAAHEIRKWGYRSSYMFQKMEEFNRLITFHAAYNLAVEKGLQELGHKGTVEDGLAALSDPEKQALQERATELGRQAVETTQGEYARWARPRAAWGKMSALLMFKMYPQFMTYFTIRDPGRWRFLAIQLMLAGALGLPFADDLLDLLTLLMNKMGMSTADLRQELRRVLTEMDANPDLVLHGTAKYGFGAGVDLSHSLSLGRVVPMMDPLTNAMMPGGNLGDEALRVQNEALGALFSIPVNVVNALSTGHERDWEKASPTVFRDAYRAYRRVRDGGELDRSGAKIADMDTSKWDHVWETTAQALGMRATRIAQRTDLNWAQKQAQVYWDARRAQIVDQFVQLIRQGMEDREAVADWQDALQEFNEQVPDGSLRINAKALIKSAKQREKNRVLKEQGLPVGKKYRGMYEEIETTYPAAASP